MNKLLIALFCITLPVFAEDKLTVEIEVNFKRGETEKRKLGKELEELGAVLEGAGAVALGTTAAAVVTFGEVDINTLATGAVISTGGVLTAYGLIMLTCHLSFKDRKKRKR